MSKTFCPLPWNHLATHPHGSVTLCCEARHDSRMSEAFDNSEKPEYRTLNNTQYDFKPIQNSESFKKVRLEMLAGQEPVQCSRCFDKERVGITSKRQFELERLEYSYDDAIKDTSADGSVDVNYEMVELRLGNHCNLACRSCNIYSSSRWFPAFEAIHGFSPTNIDKNMFNWCLDSDFWDKLFAHRKSLRLLYINGGEPLLIDKHKHFLESLVQSGDSDHIEIIYSTNTTIINTEYNDVWKKFKRVQFMLSIDDLYDRNKYIRWPSKWNTVMETFDWIRNLCETHSNLSYSVLQTVSIFNIFYLSEFEDYFSKYTNNISINFVTDPAYYDPRILPRTLKDIIISRVQGKRVEQTVTNFLTMNKDQNLLSEFSDITKKLDNLRNEDFQQTFPEWFEELSRYV